VLYPLDLPLEHLDLVIETAGVDAIVSDGKRNGVRNSHIKHFVTCDGTILPIRSDRTPQHQTEWVLLTSGTTGAPKLVVHTLQTLAGAIQPHPTPANSIVWSTFYDIRRFGGLQIFLRAMLAGNSLVLSSAHETTADFLTRAAFHGVTHISGTPSHWRRALMSPVVQQLEPRYVRLSGEIADQPILNHLAVSFPKARVAHAFATTEAGLAFEVNDGLAGFPLDVIEQTPDVEMKIHNGTLHIRSARTAHCYMGRGSPALKDEHGFVDTSDLIGVRDERGYFVGRRDGAINVGGLKVFPEEVEQIINQHPAVQMSRVQGRKNPVSGAIIVADVLLKALLYTPAEAKSIQRDILQLCRGMLSPHKIPAFINIVTSIQVNDSGKLARPHA
jgi:acyl-coenzyme A synthetase/AMP-(fatty) acid ligase